MSDTDAALRVIVDALKNRRTLTPASEQSMHLTHDDRKVQVYADPQSNDFTDVVLDLNGVSFARLTIYGAERLGIWLIASAQEARRWRGASWSA